MTGDRINEWMIKWASQQKGFLFCSQIEKLKLCVFSLSPSKMCTGSRAVGGNFAKCGTGSIITMKWEAAAQNEC